MLTEEQKEELEKILKELSDWRYGYFIGSYLHYKASRDYYSINRISIYNAKRFEETVYHILYNKHFRYAVYVSVRRDDSPSRSCLVDNDLSVALLQLMPANIFARDAFNIPLIFISVDKDPLSQILCYGRRIMKNGKESHVIVLHKQIEHVYICPLIDFIQPYAPDTTSVFNGHRGLVAYCTTLSGFERWLDVGTKYVGSQFDEVFGRALDKLKKFSEGKSKDEYCNINIISSVIHDEIEEANGLMQKYDISRVLITLS